MGSLSIWHWLVVIAVIMILFGRGRISALMGEVGTGIGAFRREFGRTGESGRCDRHVAARAAATDTQALAAGGRVVVGGRQAKPAATGAAPIADEEKNDRAANGKSRTAHGQSVSSASS